MELFSQWRKFCSRTQQKAARPLENFSGPIHTLPGNAIIVDSASSSREANSGPPHLQPSTAYEAQEILWEVRGRIFSILSWAFWTAIWLVSLAVLGLTTVFLRSVFVVLVLDLLLGGILVGVTGAVFAILPARRAEAALQEWEETMLPFIYSVKFELLPAQDGDRLADIWDRYKVIYRPLSDADVPRTGSRFYHSTTLKYRSTVRGKRGAYQFDVYARVADKFVLLVRRYSDSIPVTLSAIQTLKSDSEDVLKRLDPSEFVVGAFAASGFTPDAVAFCQSDVGRVDEGASIDLIQEIPEGYSIVSVVTG
jgi:hypothetical protein